MRRRYMDKLEEIMHKKKGGMEFWDIQAFNLSYVG